MGHKIKNVRISDDWLDLFAYGKKNKEILGVEKACQDELRTVKMEKMKKYNIVINDLSCIYKSVTK